jgi:hypothetical protein
MAEEDDEARLAHAVARDRDRQRRDDQNRRQHDREHRVGDVEVDRLRNEPEGEDHERLEGESEHGRPRQDSDPCARADRRTSFCQPDLGPRRQPAPEASSAADEQHRHDQEDDKRPGRSSERGDERAGDRLGVGRERDPGSEDEARERGGAIDDDRRDRARARPRSGGDPGPRDVAARLSGQEVVGERADQVGADREVGRRGDRRRVEEQTPAQAGEQEGGEEGDDRADEPAPTSRGQPVAGGAEVDRDRDRGEQPCADEGTHPEGACKRADTLHRRGG